MGDFRRSSIFGRRLAACLVAIFAICGCRSVEPHRVVFKTPAAGISQITVRAWKAPSATVIEESRATIEITALPALAANGYHDPDPTGREKPAEQMPLDFNIARYGSVAIISSKGEVALPHHHYCLDSIEIHVPKGTQVMRERQKLATPAKRAK